MTEPLILAMAEAVFLILRDLGHEGSHTAAKLAVEIAHAQQGALDARGRVQTPRGCQGRAPTPRTRQAASQAQPRGTPPAGGTVAGWIVPLGEECLVCRDAPAGTCSCREVDPA